MLQITADTAVKLAVADRAYSSGDVREDGKIREKDVGDKTSSQLSVIIMREDTRWTIEKIYLHMGPILENFFNYKRISILHKWLASLVYVY